MTVVSEISTLEFEFNSWNHRRGLGKYPNIPSPVPSGLDWALTGGISFLVFLLDRELQKGTGEAFGRPAYGNIHLPRFLNARVLIVSVGSYY